MLMQNMWKKKHRSSDIWPKMPLDLNLWKMPTCQTLSKTLDLLKTLAVLSVLPLRSGPEVFDESRTLTQPKSVMLEEYYAILVLDEKAGKKIQ